MNRAARKMLLETFNEEFSLLNNFFIEKKISDINPLEKTNFLEEYDLGSVISILGRFGNTIKTRDDLMNMLRLVINKGISNIITFQGNGMLYIPVFSYLLKNNPSIVEEFYEMCMKVHLVKDKESLFLGDGLNGLQVPFNFDIVNKLEMVLLSHKFYVDLRTVISILDYIDYEKFINGDKDTDFYKFLYKTEKDLFAYVSFCADDSVLLEFFKNREGNTRDYKYDKCVSVKDGLNLMSFYIDTKVPDYKNRFLKFKFLEEKLRSATDEESKKNNMMVAFTYRVYPDTDFYDCFDDVDLTMKDLLVFINRYEESGNRLSIRQLDNLLMSFRNRYLDREGLLDEFNELVLSIKNEFKEYRRTRYAFLPSDFIDYYNKIHYDTNFGMFNFGSDFTFTRNIYEMVINGNNLVGFEQLMDCDSVKEYISFKGVVDINGDIDKYNHDKAICDKYYYNLDEQYFCSDFTIEYFIRKNVSSEDMESFLDLKSWYDSYFGGKWNKSNKVKERTFWQLDSDFREELANSPFSERVDIVKRYWEYAINDDISEFVSYHYFYASMHMYEKKFINENAAILFTEVMNAYSNGEDLFSVLSNIGLAVEDVKLVFDSLGERYSEEVDSIYQKAIIDFRKHDEEVANEIKREKDSVSLALFNRFLEDTESRTLNDFCINNDLHIGEIYRMRDFAREDEALSLAYEEKLAKMKADREGVSENLDWAIDGIINGVKMDDGSVRPFTYLDFRLGTSVSVTRLVKLPTANNLVRKFTRENNNLTKFRESEVLNEKYVVMVDGEPHEVTTEEKQAALTFMDVMGLPYEIKLYNLIVRSALNGDLIMSKDSDNKVKIFVKKEKAADK